MTKSLKCRKIRKFIDSSHKHGKLEGCCKAVVLSVFVQQAGWAVLGPSVDKTQLVGPI